MQQTKLLGFRGEALITNWLEQHDYTILERNYTARVGEIDIIAYKGDVVAFVEVKTRFTKYFPICQTVNRTKQQRIIKTAKLFILKNRFIDKVFRFDIGIVTYENNQHHIDYIENAFQDS